MKLGVERVGEILNSVSVLRVAMGVPEGGVG